MKRKLGLLFAVLVCVSGMSVPAVNAIEISVGVYDQPYYIHGPGYWSGRAYYVWAPGYWEWHHHHKRWHHGYYQPREEDVKSKKRKARAEPAAVSAGESDY